MEASHPKMEVDLKKSSISSYMTLEEWEEIVSDIILDSDKRAYPHLFQHESAKDCNKEMSHSHLDAGSLKESEQSMGSFNKKHNSTAIFSTDNATVSNKSSKKKLPDIQDQVFHSKQSRKKLKADSTTLSAGKSEKPMEPFVTASNLMSGKEMTDPQKKNSEGQGTNWKNFKNQRSNAEPSKDDSNLVNIMLSEIMSSNPNVKWTDIAGLDFVKNTIQEIVIWPFLRPDIFSGLRAPPKGLLLFGPPGTGKTLIGKCIATESNSTFFCISASSLASKYVGEGEKLVRTMFAVARSRSPSVIFVDEIDSLLSHRRDGEQDFSRKLKTEFLVQFDGAKTTDSDRILVVGATNRPHELDEAARRRFVKRLYIPLPEPKARIQIVTKLLSKHESQLSNDDLEKIISATEGYSGSDMAHLCKEAAMGPIRSISFKSLESITLDQVRPIVFQDFEEALKQVRSSVSQADLDIYVEFNKRFGSGS